MTWNRLIRLVDTENRSDWEKEKERKKGILKQGDWDQRRDSVSKERNRKKEEKRYRRDWVRG